MEMCLFFFVSQEDEIDLDVVVVQCSFVWLKARWEIREREQVCDFAFWGM